MEDAGSDLNEATLAIEGDGSVVLGMDTEEEAGGLLVARAGDGAFHQATSSPGAVEFGEEIDAPELEVARLNEPEGKVGGGEHGVADGCGSGGDLGEPYAGLGFFEVREVGSGGMVLRAVGEKGIAGDETGEGFEQGGCADDSEGRRVRRGAFAQSNRGCESHGVRISHDVWARERDATECSVVRIVVGDARDGL